MNYRVSEWLKQKFFPNGPPLSDLFISKLEAEELSEKWMQGLKVFHHTDNVEKISDCWPEKYDDCQNRVKDYANELFNKYRKTDEKVAHIVVTHGINVKAYFDLAFEEYRKSDDYSSRYRFRNPKQIEYTGIVSATVRGNRSVRMADCGDVHHLDNTAAERHMARMTLHDNVSFLNYDRYIAKKKLEELRAQNEGNE